MTGKQPFAALALVALVLALTLAVSPAYAGDGGKPHKGCDMMAGHHHRVLSEAHAKLMHDAMGQAFAQNKDLMAQSKDLHKELQATLAAKTFDGKKFLALSAKLTALHDKMMQNHAEAFAGVAGKLTPEERRKMSDFGAHKMPPGWGHGKHHGMRGHGMKGAGAWCHCMKKGCPMMEGHKSSASDRNDWFSHLNR
jgi:Spy/CpxP family protein refolding chaperone